MPKYVPLPQRFFARHAEQVAQELLNCLLVTRSEEGLTVGRISETEAYTEGDAASHCYRGRTERNRVMFGPGGNAYIYFTYGMHFCMNAVTGVEGHGEAALIRAIEPIAGLELMQSRRGLTLKGLELDRASISFARAARLLTGGPARVCQAMGVDSRQNGECITRTGTIWIAAPDPAYSQMGTVTATPRVGITRDVELLRRFVLTGDRYTSRSSRDLALAAESCK